MCGVVVTGLLWFECGPSMWWGSAVEWVGPSSVGCLWCVWKASAEHHEGALLRVGAAFESDAEKYVENLCGVVWMSTMGGM